MMMIASTRRATAAVHILFAGVAMGQADGADLDRMILPLREPQRQVYTEIDVRKAKAPDRFEVRAPAGAPNVVLVLIDDLGFAGTSAFGGPVSTPIFDRIANEGLRYNNFHTTAVCSPTRAALKSGRNHHVNNMGSIIETGTSFPGNTGQIPSEVAPLAEMLRLNGYATAAFGKWHETAAWEASMAGPFDRWPTRQGSTSFTDSSVAKPTSGRPSSMTAPIRSNCRTTPTTISRPT